MIPPAPAPRFAVRLLPHYPLFSYASLALAAPPHPLAPAARKSDPDRLELLAELREALLRCQVGSGAVLADAAHGLSQRGELRRGERVEGGGGFIYCTFSKTR